MLLQCFSRPLAGFFLLLITLAASAQPATVPPPPVAASNWLLVDLTSGQTLAEHNSGERREPAS
ncbi:MAG: D-alanyl-D-alanine carboxypeptidase, partial [Betaproteobacteria bacterium]